MGGCGEGIARAFLFIFNFIFWISGAALIGVAIFIKVDPNFSKYFDLATELLESDTAKIAVWIMVGVGAFIFLIGFFGCCGALSKSTWMLIVYMIMLVLIFAGEITFGAIALLARNDIEKQVDKTGANLMETKMGSDSSFTAIMHIVQVNLKCCGIKGNSDFENNTFYEGQTDEKLPWSCCTPKPDVKLEDIKKYYNYHTANEVVKNELNNYEQCMMKKAGDIRADSCKKELIDTIKQNIVIIGGIGIGIAFVQIFGFIVSCCLVRAFRNKSEK